MLHCNLRYSPPHLRSEAERSRRLRSPAKSSIAGLALAPPRGVYPRLLASYTSPVRTSNLPGHIERLRSFSIPDPKLGLNTNSVATAFFSGVEGTVSPG